MSTLMSDARQFLNDDDFDRETARMYIQRLADSLDLELEEHRKLRASGHNKLSKAFDEALAANPFLWFELGYTRPTGWMMHVWQTGGGAKQKIITTQNEDRDEACMEAVRKMRDLNLCP